MDREKILEDGARRKLDFPRPGRACAQKAHCQADLTPHQSQRNGKSIRRQCSLLEYKTQKTPSAEWNTEQAASETTGEMSLV